MKSNNQYLEKRSNRKRQREKKIAYLIERIHSCISNFFSIVVDYLEKNYSLQSLLKLTTKVTKLFSNKLIRTKQQDKKERNLISDK